jgi:hypothetical protein
MLRSVRRLVAFKDFDVAEFEFQKQASRFSTAINDDIYPMTRVEPHAIATYMFLYVGCGRLGF